MSDENYTPEAIHAAFEDAHEKEQYLNYLYDLLGKIPLLNLWDVCYLFARVILYDRDIPDCISDIDQSLLYKNDPYSDDEEKILLSPIQKWLSEQLAKSIDTKELKPIVIGRFLNGKIDTKRTYIDDNQIDSWLECRGITECSGSEYFYFNFDYLTALERIVNSVLSASQLLVNSAYHPEIEIPDSVSRDHDHLYFENARLRAQINKYSNPPQRKPHGNEERFAKNREEVLGAALTVVVKFPKQCKNSTEKFEARKIAELIDEKGLLLWPETGNPPLSRDKMEREISKWLKAIGE